MWRYFSSQSLIKSDRRRIMVARPLFKSGERKCDEGLSIAMMPSHHGVALRVERKGDHDGLDHERQLCSAEERGKRN
ncbi:hypothetical protein EUGRSUZ_G01395 [Eucalyptus grandis]|uniref:Uncharacterized protein n=2 Tax=Eucalyptus grandis TaxID=71139 RepID=A0ACC3K3C2_EUCGR|nr:hypothetical protein EUGRSUZ_G01395 [Eucalyptus grandis]